MEDYSAIYCALSGVGESHVGYRLLFDKAFLRSKISWCRNYIRISVCSSIICL